MLNEEELAAVRAAFQEALRSAIAQAPGNRAAALVRIHNDLKRLLAKARQQLDAGDHAQGQMLEALETEIGAAVATALTELAKRD